MLKIKNIFPKIKKVYNESNYYLKIKILFEIRESLGDICYWSTLGPKKSLLEIGLEYPTGCIFEITAVISTVIHYQNIDISHNNIIEKIGLPLFDIDAWKPNGNSLGYHVEFCEQEHYLQEKNDFEVYAGKTNSTIILSNNTAVLHVVNNPIIFGFDKDNNLCYIHIKNVILNKEGFLTHI